jgi:hypothetical protein
MNNISYFDPRTNTNDEYSHAHIPHNRLFESEDELQDYCDSYGHREPRYDLPLNFDEA